MLKALPLFRAPCLALVAFAVLLLVVDQTSKAWMRDLLLDPPQRIAVLPFFSLTPVWNRGVSFGLFAADSQMGVYVLSAFALIVCGILLYLLKRSVLTVERYALVAVISGALGNVIDRLLFGAVFDFLDFHVQGWHWPAFNVADSCIVLGVLVLLWLSFTTQKTVLS